MTRLTTWGAILAVSLSTACNGSKPLAEMSPGELQEACDKDNAEACEIHGLTLWKASEFDDADATRAVVAALDKACKGNRVKACSRLGSIHMAHRDATAAIQPLKKACDLADAGSCSLLGNCYLLGLGTEQDLSEAVKAFSVACKNSDPEGCFMVGGAFVEGYGDHEIDVDKGLAMMMQASEDGYAKGFRKLASYYATATGDVNKVVDLLKKGCAAGDQEACEVDNHTDEEPQYSQELPASGVTLRVSSRLDDYLQVKKFSCETANPSSGRRFCQLTLEGKAIPSQNVRFASEDSEGVEVRSGIWMVRDDIRPGKTFKSREVNVGAEASTVRLSLRP